MQVKPDSGVSPYRAMRALLFVRVCFNVCNSFAMSLLSCLFCYVSFAIQQYLVLIINIMFHALVRKTDTDKQIFLIRLFCTKRRRPIVELLCLFRSPWCPCVSVVVRAASGCVRYMCALHVLLVWMSCACTSMGVSIATCPRVHVLLSYISCGCRCHVGVDVVCRRHVCVIVMRVSIASSPCVPSLFL